MDPERTWLLMRIAFCCSVYLIFHILQVLYAVEKMTKDIKARGGGNLKYWLIPGYITGISTMIIYFIFRPRGKLENCPECTRAYLHSTGKCPSCGNEGKEEDKIPEKKSGRKNTTSAKRTREDLIMDRWNRREVWVKTSPSSGNGRVELEERISVQDSSKVRGGSLKKAKRSSGECPNCSRELYDWEDRCSRCGKKA